MDRRKRIKSLVASWEEVYLSYVIKLLVFDLDGTLVDTLGDLGNSVNYALVQFGAPALPRSIIKENIGDGARRLVERSLQAAKQGETSSQAEIDVVLSLFLEHYHLNCIVESHCYAGIPTVFKGLEKYRKAVLTNKPLKPASRILEALGLSPYFEWIVGGDNVFGTKPNPAALQNLIVSADAKPEQTVMIGDGIQDLQVARLAGTHFLGFLNGLGSRQSLLAEQPEAILEDMTFLPEALTLLAVDPEGLAGDANSISQGRA
jgi:phosphoglycolate phosphatase